MGPHLKLWLAPDSVQACLSPGGLPPALFAEEMCWLGPAFCHQHMPHDCAFSVVFVIPSPRLGWDQCKAKEVPP